MNAIFKKSIKDLVGSSTVQLACLLTATMVVRDHFFAVASTKVPEACVDVVEKHAAAIKAENFNSAIWMVGCIMAFYAVKILIVFSTFVSEALNNRTMNGEHAYDTTSREGKN